MCQTYAVPMCCALDVRLIFGKLIARNTTRPIVCNSALLSLFQVSFFADRLRFALFPYFIFLLVVAF